VAIEQTLIGMCRTARLENAESQQHLNVDRDTAAAFKKSLPPRMESLSEITPGTEEGMKTALRAGVESIIGGW
jgi:hypothetical protein